MNLEAFLTQTLVGLYTGSFYWLLTLGLTLIFGVTRIVNFAHASFFVLGSYLMYTFYIYTNNFILSLFTATITTGLIGVIFEITLIRRVYKIKEMYQLLLTLGIALTLNESQKLIWGTTPKYINMPELISSGVSIGYTNISYYSIAVISIGLILFTIIHIVINKTLWGLKIRAVWRDNIMAQALKINPYLIYTTVFFIGIALAGFGGALMIILHPVGPGVGDHLIIYAFIIVVIASLGNITGAYITSLLIGVISSLATWLAPEIDIVIIYLITVIILLLRPGGLFGER
jgi:branched-subunit amino acid ABC-type transport system permease component